MKQLLAFLFLICFSAAASTPATSCDATAQLIARTESWTQGTRFLRIYDVIVNNTGLNNCTITGVILKFDLSAGSSISSVWNLQKIDDVHQLINFYTIPPRSLSGVAGLILDSLFGLASVINVRIVNASCSCRASPTTVPPTLRPTPPTTAPTPPPAHNDSATNDDGHGFCGDYGNQDSKYTDNFQFYGNGLSNQHWQPKEKLISPDNVAQLHAKWRLPLDKPGYTSPLIFGPNAYFPTHDGAVFAVRRLDGKVIWMTNVSELLPPQIYNPAYTGYPIRTMPVVYENQIIVGTLPGAFIVSLDINSGDILWTQRAEEHPTGIITASPLRVGKMLYVGLSSNEEELALRPDFQCCTHRGAVVALDLETHQIKWTFYTVPDPNGSLPNDSYSGAAVFGSLSADLEFNALFFATGNLYAVPRTVRQCINQAGGPGAPNAGGVHNCIDASTVYVDAILAIDLTNGSLIWHYQPPNYDVWNANCGFPGNSTNPNCPEITGPDAGFAQGPVIYTIKDPATGRPRRVAGTGQKNGVQHLLDAKTGKLIWTLNAGPGSYGGGLQWGSATDGKIFYAPVANVAHLPFVLTKPSPSAGSARNITSGFWSAFNASTGEILWQTPSPYGDQLTPWSPPTLANGVLFATGGQSRPFGGDTIGAAFAMDARTGEILWQFETPPRTYLNNYGAPSIADGEVYWLLSGLQAGLFAFTLSD